MNPALIAYVRDARAKGSSDADIKSALVASGWDTSEVDGALAPQPAASSQSPAGAAIPAKPAVDKRKQPLLYALSNLLFPGGGYLMLPHYPRFFGVVALLSVLAVAAPIATFMLVPLVCVDTFLLARKWNEDLSSRRPEKKGLNVLGWCAVGALIGLTSLTNVSPQLLAPSKKACGWVYALNLPSRLRCEKARATSDAFAKFDADKAVMDAKKKTDPRCEGFVTDKTLVNAQGGTFGYSFQEYCYAQKAVETGDALYCLSGVSPFDCLQNIAARKNDASMCDLYPAGAARCRSDLADDYGRLSMMTRYAEDKCVKVDFQHATARCESEFGAFFTESKAYWDQALKVVDEKRGAVEAATNAAVNAAP